MDEDDKKREQDSRAILRERFLRAVSGLVGSDCSMTTVENTQISGVYQGMDLDGQDVFIRNLTTPMGHLKYALVRTIDVTHMTLKHVPSRS